MCKEECTALVVGVAWLRLIHSPTGRLTGGNASQKPLSLPFEYLASLLQRCVSIIHLTYDWPGFDACDDFRVWLKKVKEAMRG